MINKAHINAKSELNRCGNKTCRGGWYYQL